MLVDNLNRFFGLRFFRTWFRNTGNHNTVFSFSTANILNVFNQTKHFSIIFCIFLQFYPVRMRIPFLSSKRPEGQL